MKFTDVFGFFKKVNASPEGAAVVTAATNAAISVAKAKLSPELSTVSNELKVLEPKLVALIEALTKVQPLIAAASSSGLLASSIDLKNVGPALAEALALLNNFEGILQQAKASGILPAAK